MYIYIYILTLKTYKTIYRSTFEGKVETHDWSVCMWIMMVRDNNGY